MPFLPQDSEPQAGASEADPREVRDTLVLQTEHLLWGSHGGDSHPCGSESAAHRALCQPGAGSQPQCLPVWLGDGSWG